MRYKDREKTIFWIPLGELAMRQFIGLAMAMMTVTIAVPLVATMTPIAVAAETAPQPDSRIKEALEKLGLKYEVTKSGNFKVVFKVQDNRTQVVTIVSKTEKVQGLEIREISSPAYTTKGDISANVSNQLLKDSYRRKLGGWGVIRIDDDSLALFSAKVDANQSVDDLKTSILLAVYAADEMEKSLTQDDKF
jgi:hypothetical protein